MWRRSCLALGVLILLQVGSSVSAEDAPSSPAVKNLGSKQDAELFEKLLAASERPHPYTRAAADSKGPPFEGPQGAIHRTFVSKPVDFSEPAEYGDKIRLVLNDEMYGLLQSGVWRSPYDVLFSMIRPGDPKTPYPKPDFVKRRWTRTIGDNPFQEQYDVSSGIDLDQVEGIRGFMDSFWSRYTTPIQRQMHVDAYYDSLVDLTKEYRSVGERYYRTLFRATIPEISLAQEDFDFDSHVQTLDLSDGRVIKLVSDLYRFPYKQEAMWAVLPRFPRKVFTSSSEDAGRTKARHFEFPVEPVDADAITSNSGFLDLILSPAPPKPFWNRKTGPVPLMGGEPYPESRFNPFVIRAARLRVPAGQVEYRYVWILDPVLPQDLAFLNGPGKRPPNAPDSTAVLSDASRYSRGQDLLAAALAASGGEALTALRDITIESSGTFMVQGTKFDFSARELYMVPDCERIEQKLPMGTISQAVCGDEAWINNIKGPRNMSAEELNAAKVRQTRELWRVLTGYSSLKLNALPEERMVSEEGPSIVVAVENQQIEGWKIYLSKVSGRIVGMDMQSKSGKGENVLRRTLFDDYRPVGNIFWPYRKRIYEDGVPIAVSTVASCVTNSGLTEKDFKRP